MLLTNRLILQPRIEANLFGKSDSARGLGSGLSSWESGFRLRYELRPGLAPYVGVAWDRKLLGTADMARARGEEAFRWRLTFGLRTWC
jgi:copper resistance protein B